MISLTFCLIYIIHNQVRSLASSFLIAWMWFSNFLLLRYFGTIAISLGLHATYYICACITLMGAGYIYFILPETKGKSQNQIAEALDGPWILFKKKRKNERWHLTTGVFTLSERNFEENWLADVICVFRFEL